MLPKIVSPNDETPKEAFNNAKLKINQVIQKITKPLKRNSLELNHYNKKINVFKDVKSNTTFNEFKKMVNKAKKYIFLREKFFK